MAVSVLIGAFIGVGVILFVLSYFVVERKKDVTEGQKKNWYKRILVPWLTFMIGGLVGEFLMHRDYCNMLEGYVCVPKHQVERTFKPERISSHLRRELGIE